MSKVLVVDDEKAIRFTLTEFLRRDGYDATMAEDAKSAMGLLRSERFDVVVTDIIMPRVSGTELLQKIREYDEDTQVIVLTGEPSLETAVEAVRAGAYDYLPKPIRREEFLKTVGKAARLKALIDDRHRLEEANEQYRLELEATVERRTEALQETMSDMIYLISSIVEKRDLYTAGHQTRVGNLAADLADELEMDEESVHIIRVTGYIHDIGKIEIPAEILAKPARLTREEMALVRRHPITGFELLRDVNVPGLIAELVHQHHERMDGSGYPRGLTAEQMLYETHPLVVADVVEAMISHRPYRPALGIEVALEEITSRENELYHPDAVRACVQLFAKKDYAVNGSRSPVRFPLERSRR
ncbi:MAG: HD domain-containing phosphohydrolase [Clostridia bacterium]